MHSDNSDKMFWIITLFTLLPLLHTQSAATLTQPPLIETNTYTLRKTSLNVTSPTTSIAYMQSYSNAPQVFLSIVTMNCFTRNSLLSYSMTLTAVSTSQFTVQYSISCLALGVTCSFYNIVVDYLAFDFNTYSFVQMLDESFIIDPAALTNNQYYQVNYMERLSHGHSYSLNCMLSGFTGMAITGKPSLYISTIENDRDSYYLGVRFENMLLVSFNFVRILIDETTMNAASTGPSSLTCSIGTIVHYSDVNAVERNPSPDFLPFAVFFGVSGFSGYDISLSNLTYIFNNTTPRMSANIGYILFITSSCPSNQLYVTAQNLCYSLSSAFYYQATPATMQPCPFSCYQCVGPLTTQCRSCVQGWNRVLSAGRCVCISGFYDPGAPSCKNCTEAIAGCKTCSSATNCLTCLTGCTVIGFSPIYCDCPTHIQTNYSFNCPTSFFFDYTINVCTCLPQTYYNSASGLCFPCATGCYLCAKNASYCLACIASYRLVDNACIYYYMSYALLGQGSTYNNPQIRCLRWDQSSGICTQRCKYYFYEGNCYSKCPLGTFNISFPWMTCQPCQKSCNYCFNYTICYLCNTDYYYFNTSILSCSPCPDHCIKCTNASYCTQCDSYYLLSNGGSSCLLPSIPTVNCDDNCNYCLIPHQCLQCMMGYFLNRSSHICLTCDPASGLQLQSDGCQEVCGDGKIINQECDDGNRISGDGCSVNCELEVGFECKQIGGVSRCWGRSISIDWLIFSVLGSNSVIMSMQSSFPLSNTIMDLKCGFKSVLAQRISVNDREQLTITYQESLVRMGLANYSNTLGYYSGNITNNLCQITFNQLYNVTFPVNAAPTPFLVDYASVLQTISNGKAMRMANKISVYFTLATMILGLSPMASYASSRFLMLFLVTFSEYMHMPINSFPPYESLQGALFVPPSTTTRELLAFSSQYYVGVLWHLIVAYIAVAVWLEVLVPFLVRMSKGMEWGLLMRMAAVIAENKPIAYQNMYIGYEVVIWCLLGRIFANISQASSTLIFLAVLHLIFSIVSKIHFYLTFQNLKKNYPQLTHTMVMEQVQNVCLALASATTTDKSSYTPILMILFGVYSLLAMGRNMPQQPKEDSFHITLQMAVWQMRIGYLCQMGVQCLKMAFMWCGHLLSDPKEYETVGEAIGLAISLLISLYINMGAFNSFLVHLIKICEVKNQGRATIPSTENLDAQTADGNSHSD